MAKDGCGRHSKRIAALAPRVIVVLAVLVLARRFGSGLGYLARYFTAETVGDLLGRLGVAALSSHDVLLLENGIAQVDLPCSGLKSVWTGLVFLVAATLMRGRSFGWGFLAVATITELAILVGNTTRIAILVLLALVAGQPKWAAAAHVPLGLLFFGLACLGGYALLGLLPPADPAPGRRRAVLEWSVAGLALVGVAWVGLRESRALEPPELPVIAPDSQSQPLSALEQRFFAGKPARIAKWRLTLPDVGRTRQLDLLMVGASTWRAHHAPELCLAAGGWRVESLETRRPASLFELRHLSLEGGRRQAIYFFQSRQGTTAQLERRLWRELWEGDDAWVLVTLIFDGDLALDSPFLTAYLRDLHAEIARSLSAPNGSNS